MVKCWLNYKICSTCSWHIPLFLSQHGQFHLRGLKPPVKNDLMIYHTIIFVSFLNCLSSTLCSHLFRNRYLKTKPFQLTPVISDYPLFVSFVQVVFSKLSIRNAFFKYIIGADQYLMGYRYRRFLCAPSTLQFMIFIP